MMVLTSDHVIQPLHVLRDNAATAAGFAARDRLVVFGIPPTRPETGYGYIETGKRLGEDVYAVAAFREKPDPQSAKRFAASKRFFWNSGMFAFSAGFMAGRFRALAPEVFGPFAKLKAPAADAWTIKKGLRILSAWEGLAAAYRKTKSISFDYAVAEHCAESVCVRAAFDWIDVGNWEEYAKLRGNTGAELYCSGAGEESCFVDSDIPVALAGVEDLIVVIRSGKDGSAPVALVTRKGRTQQVREAVEAIKQSGKTALL
jgi:mannose-1-phosphate guanylyltransferase